MSVQELLAQVIRQVRIDIETYHSDAQEALHEALELQKFLDALNDLPEGWELAERQYYSLSSRGFEPCLAVVNPAYPGAYVVPHAAGYFSVTHAKTGWALPHPKPNSLYNCTAMIAELHKEPALAGLWEADVDAAKGFKKAARPILQRFGASQ